ncbi:hypothetical protein ABK040_011942 [Willaertia magna]
MELLRVMNDNNNDTFNSIPSFHKKILLPIKFIKNSEEYIILITIADEIFIYKHIMGETFEFIKIKNNLNKICDLECGNLYSIILNNYNELFIYGTFESLFNNLNEFIKLKFNYNEKIKFIRCGFNFIYLITNNNSIYSIGKNNYGQLGLEKEITFRNFFTKINILTNVKDLQCGSVHAILLDNFGNIYGTGYNNWYSLGFAEENAVYGFIKINLTFKVKNISCCNFSTLLINEFNELFGSGKNAFGELGINNKNYRIGFSDEIFIGKDKKVEKLFKSFDFCNFLLANDNSIYVSVSISLQVMIKL